LQQQIWAAVVGVVVDAISTVGDGGPPSFKPRPQQVQGYAANGTGRLKPSI